MRLAECDLGSNNGPVTETLPALIDPPPDTESIQCLIAEWIKHRDAAAELLVTELNLDSPRDILKPEHRGRRELPGTGWQYRTHGIGVDVTRTNGHGGIDFDFSTRDGEMYAAPDWWRLQLFAKRSVGDKSVDSDRYTTIIEHADEHRDLIETVIAETIGR